MLFRKGFSPQKSKKHLCCNLFWVYPKISLVCLDYMLNMERIGLTASEEMSFENVDGRRTEGRTDDGRTPDACIYYKLTYEPSAQVS